MLLFHSQPGLNVVHFVGGPNRPLRMWGQVRESAASVPGLQLEVCRIVCHAQFLKAGTSAKCAPGEDSWLQLKGLGRDGREIDLFAGQHHGIDERGSVHLRPFPFRRDRPGDPLGLRDPIRDPEVLQQVQRLRKQVAPALAQFLALALRQLQL
jgi:hypothetical protein